MSYTEQKCKCNTFVFAPISHELNWCGYTWSAVVRLVGCTAKFSETPLETAYGREMNIQFTGNSSGGHSALAFSMPIAHSLKTCDICGFVL